MKTLRELIRKILLEEVQNPDMVGKLNELIDAENEKEATWNLARWNRDNPYAEPPNQGRKQIELLMHSLDWIENPPKELKCWYIIEAIDGEIIGQSRHLSYDEVLQYAKENDFHPADELGNPNPDGPSKDKDSAGLYFIYKDDLPIRETRRLQKRILLENQSHFNKIADLICSEKIDRIQQALELAKGMEYIGDYTYKEETHYATRSHGWTFSEYDETFLSVLSDRIKEKTLFRRPGSEGISFVAPFHNSSYSSEASGSVSIRLIQHPPFK